MVETGLTQYWQRKYWPPKSSCPSKGPSRSGKRLSKRDMASAFVLFAIGSTASVIAFVVEILVHRRSLKPVSQGQPSKNH